MDELLAELNLGPLMTALVAFIPNVLIATVILMLFWVGFRASRIPIRAALKRTAMDEVLVRIIVDSLYKYALMIFGLVMAASQLGINMAAALAGLGVFGIAVGFAAQDSLSNFISGFLIFWDKPFKVGDWIEVAGEKGQVFNITMRTTRIRTRGNNYIIIPNKKIIDEVLINESKNGETRVEVPIGIAYKEDIPEARHVILKACEENRHFMHDPAPEVVLLSLGDSSVNLEFRAWVQDAKYSRRAYFQSIECIKLALDEAGIEIPFPHLQLHVDEVNEDVWQGYLNSRS